MKKTIGFPRALFYYDFYEHWQAFFEKEDFEVLVSPPTNQKIVNRSLKISENELCFPCKIYLGHVDAIINEVDYLFIPRFIDFGPKKCFCPKFMGLPDIIKSTFAGKIAQNNVEMITPTIKGKRNIYQKMRELKEITSDLKMNNFSTLKNIAKQKNISLSNKEITQSKQVQKGKVIGVIGHSYILDDPHLSMNLLKQIKNKNFQYYRPAMFSDQIIIKYQKLDRKIPFWYYHRKYFSVLLYWLEKDLIDGLILVSSFGCGPDSLVNKMIKIEKEKYDNVPLLELYFDEHTAEAGINTRLAAFFDLVEGGDRFASSNISTYG